MSYMEYDATKYLVRQRYLSGKLIRKNLVIYKNMNKGKQSVENSSPLYQTHTSTAI